jgi:hypothetical protein
MWRARFRQQGTEQWLWTRRTTDTAREALALAQLIATGQSRASLINASGQRADHTQIDHRDYHAVPATDLGYTAPLAR